MNAKAACLAAVCLLSAAAFCQIKTEEQPIQAAFDTLRGHPGLQITLDQTQQVGDTTTGFKSVTYWFQDVEDGRPMAKVEMMGYLNGTQTFHLVGDGTTLYTYDATRNEYSATRYGNYNGAQPNDYVNALLNSLKSMLKGQSIYPGRLLNEVYAGDTSRYTTWVPGANIEDTGQVVRYTLGNPVHRSLEFWYTNVPPNTYLSHVDYFDSVDLGDVTRQINWTITLQSYDVALSDSSFKFTPPIGAKPVAGVRVVTG